MVSNNWGYYSIFAFADRTNSTVVYYLYIFVLLQVALRIRPVLNEETAKGAAVIANKTDDRVNYNAKHSPVAFSIIG